MSAGRFISQALRNSRRAANKAKIKVKDEVGIITAKKTPGQLKTTPATRGQLTSKKDIRTSGAVGVVGGGVIAATISQLSKPKSENRLSKAAAKPIAEKLVKNNNDKKLSAKQLSEFKAMFKKKMDENKSLIKRGMPPRKTFKFMGKPYQLREK